MKSLLSRRLPPLQRKVTNRIDSGNRTLLLERLLNDEAMRNELVQHLIGKHSSNVTFKIRFLLAVNDFQRTKAKKEKKFKAEKIVNLFFDPESSYYLQGLPEHLSTEFQKISKRKAFQHQEALILIVKNYVFEELKSHQVILDYLLNLNEQAIQNDDGVG